MDLCKVHNVIDQQKQGPRRRLNVHSMGNAIKYTSEGYVELNIRWQALGSGAKGEYGILSVQS